MVHKNPKTPQIVRARCKLAQCMQPDFLRTKCTWPKIRGPLSEELGPKQGWTPSLGSRSANLTQISIIYEVDSAHSDVLWPFFLMSLAEELEVKQAFILSMLPRMFMLVLNY